MIIDPNPRKTASVRNLGAVDIAQLKQAVAAIPEALWLAEDSKKPNRRFTALDTTRHIVFRFVSNFRDWRESTEWPLWNQWKPLLQPVLATATAPYGYAHGAFPRVMLARMAPGGVITPHRDANPAAKWPHKIHVPIQTNRDVTFYVDDAALPFRGGRSDRSEQHGLARGGQSRNQRSDPFDFRILRR